TPTPPFGGQGVAGPNPAVPTQVRGFDPERGVGPGDHIDLPPAFLAHLDRWSLRHHNRAANRPESHLSSSNRAGRALLARRRQVDRAGWDTSAGRPVTGNSPLSQGSRSVPAASRPGPCLLLEPRGSSAGWSDRCP